MLQAIGLTLARVVLLAQLSSGYCRIVGVAVPVESQAKLVVLLPLDWSLAPVLQALGLLLHLALLLAHMSSAALCIAVVAHCKADMLAPAVLPHAGREVAGSCMVRHAAPDCHISSHRAHSMCLCWDRRSPTGNDPCIVDSSIPHLGRMS